MCSFFTFLLLTVGIATASQVINDQVFQDDQPTDPKIIPIVDLKRTDDNRGQFSFGYKSADGTTVEERGVLKQTPDKSDYVLVKSGHYYYFDKDHHLIDTEWIADENGFRATGDHLPKV